MHDAPASSSQSGRALMAEEAPRPMLGLPAAMALIVGVVIGAGIFKAPSMVAGMSGSAGWMFFAWSLGALISLAGALCYAELATAYPHAGGDYHFLLRAYGRSLSFLFAWARFSVIATGSIALLAFVFGDYLSLALPLPLFDPAWSPAIYAAAIILLLSAINLYGIRAGSMAQSWLTAVEVGGLLLIVAAALSLETAGAPTDAASAATAASPGAATPGLSTFGLAMVFVLLTYGGWNEAAYISAELRDARRNMVRALIWSILLIGTLYLLVNWAYWHGLGMGGLARSEAPAADLLRLAFGPLAEKLIALMVALSALTSINATMIVGARSSYAAGRDWPALRYLGHWNAERGTPDHALRVQCAASLLLVALGAWLGSGFKSMVEFTAPVFWLFFLLTGISLFVLRWREPAIERPFRVPLYPVLPLLFCLVCLYMLWSSLSYVYSQSLGGLNAAWIGVVVLALGLLFLVFVRAGPAPPGADDAAQSSRRPS